MYDVMNNIKSLFPVVVLAASDRPSVLNVEGSVPISLFKGGDSFWVIQDSNELISIRCYIDKQLPLQCTINMMYCIIYCIVYMLYVCHTR